MEIVILILLYLNYTGFGIVEGVMWSKQGAQAFSWNEHAILAVQRVLFGATVWLASTYPDARIVLLASLPAFWFFHNGGMYQTRYFIDGAYDGFWEDSTTSTAGINITWQWRWKLAAVSVVIFITLKMMEVL